MAKKGVRGYPWIYVAITCVDPFIGMLCLRNWLAAALYLVIEFFAMLLLAYLEPHMMQYGSGATLLGIIFFPIRLSGVVHAYVIVNVRNDRRVNL